LGGTSATFSSSVQTANAVNGGGFIMWVDGNAGSRSWKMVSDSYNYGDFGLQQATTYGGSVYANKLIVNAGNLTIGSVPGTGSGNLYAATGTFNGSGNRPVTIDSGINIKGESGGWAMQYSFLGSSGTARGGFGALGSADSLTYFYIGIFGSEKLTIDNATSLASFAGAINATGNITGAYILGTYFNASAGNSENPTIGQIWTQNTTDNYLRKSTPAHFRSQIIDGYYVPLRSQSNWNDATSVIGNVVGLLAWKNYSNGHVIFDASASTSPSGTAVSNTNPQNNWVGSYPTLMGWNGSGTYGVRVDSARVADSTGSATTAATVTHSSGRTDATYYNVVWATGNPSQMYSCDAVKIQSSTGTLQAANLYATSLVTSRTIGDYRQSTPGTLTGVGLYVTNASAGNAYGLLVGSSYTYGDVWLQAGRADGNASAYNISLNASGGTVTVGATQGFDKLTLGGGKFYLSYAANQDVGGAMYAYNDTAYQTYAGGLKLQVFRNTTGVYLMYDALTLAGSGAATFSSSVTATGGFFTGLQDGVVNQDNGTSAAWRGRILSKNSTADVASFLGTYGSIAGVFAHNNALTNWADLYVNTVSGTTGGSVRLPVTTYINTYAAVYESGTWGISITGNAGTSTTTTFVASPDGGRNPNTAPLPTTNPRAVSYNFAGAGYITGATGNYAGVMTYAPWDGTSASTGDSSYQLAFCNFSGVNASGLPGLALRNGINSTWNATWYQILHSGNYNSYAPTLTGGGASGNWAINSTNITAYTINQNVGIYNNPSFSGVNLDYSLHVNGANNAASAAGGITLWGNADTTTSYIGFKNSTSTGWGVHGAITAGEYATYFVMDTITRGWIFRHAIGGVDFSGTNVASISNTGVITATTFVGALTGNATTANRVLETSETNLNTAFTNTPAGQLSWTENYNQTNAPTPNTYYNTISMRHSNASNVYGNQLAIRWVDAEPNTYVRVVNNNVFGTWRVVLTDFNYSSYAVPVGGAVLDSIFYFRSNLGPYSGTLVNPSLQVYNTASGSAFMSFHRSGYYAVNFGLDADNVMRIGGWSAAANRWQLDMSGNQTVAGTSTATGFFESSDSRFKQLIQDDYRAFGVQNIKPKLYIKNGKEEVGYFAQDFQSILASAVSQSKEGFLNLSYTQVHTAKIAIIEDEVDILKRRVAELEAKLN
jgi:hypothetical protein